MTAAEVLRRYKDEELPAFCGIDLRDVNQVGLFGERPLGVASVRGNLDEIKALIEGGADINAAGERGNTALHDAVCQGNASVVKLLLQSGARLDLRNDAGQTALEVARLGRHRELLPLLQTPPIDVHKLITDN